MKTKQANNEYSVVEFKYIFDAHFLDDGNDIMRCKWLLLKYQKV